MAKKVITDEQREEMKALYTKAMLPFEVIAQRVGVSRQAVGEALKKMGVNTAKARIVIPCSECGQPVSKTRAEVRKHADHFCDNACYSAWLRKPETHDTLRSYGALHHKVGESFALGPLDYLYYNAKTKDTYIFGSRELFLEWQRSGLPMEVESVKERKMITVRYGK